MVIISSYQTYRVNVTHNNSAISENLNAIRTLSSASLLLTVTALPIYQYCDI